MAVAGISSYLSLLLRAEGYTLPEEIVRMRDALSALDRAAGAERFPEGNELKMGQSISAELVETALTGELGAALDSGEPITLDLSPLRRYREELGLAQERRRLIDSASSSLAAQLTSRVKAVNREIVTAHLAPALAECMDQARPLVLALGNREPSRAGLFDASKEARLAFTSLEPIAERYVNLRRAWRNLQTLVAGRGVRDRQHLLLSEFTLAGLDAAWPGWDRVGRNLDGSTVVPVEPWPSDPVGRLAWIVSSGIEVWMPTLEELDEALHELDELRTGERVAGGLESAQIEAR